MPNITYQMPHTTYRIDTYTICTSSFSSFLLDQTAVLLVFPRSTCPPWPWPLEREHVFVLVFDSLNVKVPVSPSHTILAPHLLTTLLILFFLSSISTSALAVGRHVARSQDQSRSWRILIRIFITTFSTTRQAGGCKYVSYMLVVLRHISLHLTRNLSEQN